MGAQRGKAITIDYLLRNAIGHRDALFLSMQHFSIAYHKRLWHYGFMNSAHNTKFAIGNKVVDGDGYHGYVTEVTTWKDSVWYSVRFDGGTAVRYDSDLTLTGGYSLR